MTDWTWEEVAHQDSLTEGPAWDGSALLYSQCYANLTWRYDPQTGDNAVWRRDTRGGNGMVFDKDGRLFVCEGAGRRVTRVENGELVEVVADKYEGKTLNAPNDLAIDSRGRVWFTNPNYGERPMELDHESVHRADPGPDGSWSVTRVTFDTNRPNGILFSIDQNTLYVAESPNNPSQRRELRAYPVRDDGALGDHEVLHDFGTGRGIDGMCLDTEGNVIATAGSYQAGPGPMIYVFAPGGRVISTHPTPVDMPTNCTFGEAGLDVLYVTFGTGHVYRAPDTGRRGRLAYPPAH